LRNGVAFLTWVAVDGAVDALGAAVAVHVHLEHRGHHGRRLLPRVLVLPLGPLLLLVLVLVTVLPLVVLLVLVAVRRRGRVAGVGRGGRLLLAVIRRLLLLPAAAAVAATTTPSTAAALLLRSINTTPLVHYTIHRPGAMGSKENKNRENY